MPFECGVALEDWKEDYCDYQFKCGWKDLCMALADRVYRMTKGLTDDESDQERNILITFLL